MYFTVNSASQSPMVPKRRTILKSRMITNQKHVTRRQIHMPRMYSVADLKQYYWHCLLASAWIYKHVRLCEAVHRDGGIGRSLELPGMYRNCIGQLLQSRIYLRTSQPDPYICVLILPSDRIGLPSLCHSASRLFSVASLSCNSRSTCLEWSRLETGLRIVLIGQVFMSKQPRDSTQRPVASIASL